MEERRALQESLSAVLSTHEGDRLCVEISSRLRGHFPQVRDMYGVGDLHMHHDLIRRFVRHQTTKYGYDMRKKGHRNKLAKSIRLALSMAGGRGSYHRAHREELKGQCASNMPIGGDCAAPGDYIIRDDYTIPDDYTIRGDCTIRGQRSGEVYEQVFI